MIPPQSYSSLSTFKNCPRAYHERFVLKTVKFETSPALERGRGIHTALEAALKTGAPIPDDVWLPDGLMEGLRASGAIAEAPLAVDGQWQQVEFFSKHPLLRGKIDVLSISGDGVEMIDWKTGKYRPDELQADIYAGLIRAVTENHGLPVKFSWVYVEPHVKRHHSIMVDTGATSRVKSAIETLHKVDRFDERPSPLCKWCAVVACKFNRSNET